MPTATEYGFDRNCSRVTVEEVKAITPASSQSRYVENDWTVSNRYDARYRQNPSNLSLLKELFFPICSVEDALIKLGIHNPTSIDDIYENVKDAPHGAYISVWLLGLLEKKKCPGHWQHDLYRCCIKISEMPSTIHLINLEQILLAYNPIRIGIGRVVSPKYQ